MRLDDTRGRDGDSAVGATVGALWDRYRVVVFSKIAPGTQRAYGYAWSMRVAPWFAHRPIDSITTLDVEEAFASWSGSESTRADALGALSALCRVAVKGGLIASNPCVGIDRRRGQAADVAGRALTLTEYERLLDVLPPSGPYRRFVLAMVYTGCRLGEVAGLRVGDVDWAERTIKVSRTASPGFRGELVVGPTKGRRTRSVPVVDQLVPILREASEGKGEHEYLFTGPRGGFINSKNLSRALGWHSIRDGVKTFGPGERALHWHDLRHTAAVFFFDAGLPAPDVQAILGHSSLLVTQLYADTRRLAARRAVPALSQFLGSQSRGQLGGGESAAKSASDLGI
ncbi:MAG: site-specific integrase [Microcella pacifica]|uniref:tyrosine-type recombinase/integrase n=1 Tax=Microcella pacifica TaxID=2591847 RepID=UPI0033160EDC